LHLFEQEWYREDGAPGARTRWRTVDGDENCFGVSAADVLAYAQRSPPELQRGLFRPLLDHTARRASSGLA
jgi:hypothetical protein